MTILNALEAAHAQNQMIRLYTNVDLKTRHKLGMKFLKENPDIQGQETLKGLVYGVENVTTKMAIGALAGAGVGLIVGLATAAPTVGTSVVPSVLTGAKIGGGIGIGIGICQMPSVYVNTIHQSRRFVDWKTRALRDNIYPIFEEYIRKDQYFEDLICPISLCIPLIPVRTPCGHVFEKERIEGWLQDLPEDGHPCPKCRAHFTVLDLRYDEVHVYKIMQQIRTVMVLEARRISREHDLALKEGMGDRKIVVAEAKIMPEAVKEGLQHLHLNYKENSFQVFKSEQERLSYDAFMSGASAEAAAEAFKELYKKHAAEPLEILKKDEPK